MLTKQFLLSCQLPGHPGNRVINTPAPNRPKRKPTNLKYREEIQHLPPITDKASLKSNNKRIHTETVQKVIGQCHIRLLIFLNLDEGVT